MVGRPAQISPSADLVLSSLTDPQDKALVKQRNQWFFKLEVERKQEKLFELEVLLKGLDRFFNLNNLPIANRENVIGRDFSVELRTLRESVFRVVALVQSLIPGQNQSALHFQNYVESRLLNDYQRAQNIEQYLGQNTPEESLYVLLFSFINFYEILGNLTRNKAGSYQLFYNIEQLLSREIAGNRFFNPFKAAGFAPHYDAIQSPAIVKIVRGITEPEVKKYVSIVLLILFKMLRYLRFIRSESTDIETLQNSLLIYALLNSECAQLVEFVENDVCKRLALVKENSSYNLESLIDIMDSLVFQLDLEFKKVLELELKNATAVKQVDWLRNGMVRSKGLFTTIFQQGIVHIVQFFKPDLQGRDVFRDFISRLEQSLKLRKDIWLFLRIIENLEHVIEECENKAQVIPIIEAIKTLRGFIFYYQNVSFQFVRCYDRDEFQHFFELVDSFNPTEVSTPERFEPFKLSLHAFKVFMETTLRSVNNRAELQNLPFGTEEGERLLAQFLL